MTETSGTSSREPLADDGDGAAVEALTPGGPVELLGRPVGVESVDLDPPRSTGTASARTWRPASRTAVLN